MVVWEGKGFILQSRMMNSFPANNPAKTARPLCPQTDMKIISMGHGMVSGVQIVIDELG